MNLVFVPFMACFTTELGSACCPSKPTINHLVPRTDRGSLWMGDCGAGRIFKQSADGMLEREHFLPVDADIIDLARTPEIADELRAWLLTVLDLLPRELRRPVGDQDSVQPAEATAEGVGQGSKAAEAEDEAGWLPRRVWLAACSSERDATAEVRTWLASGGDINATVRDDQYTLLHAGTAPTRP